MDPLLYKSRRRADDLGPLFAPEVPPVQEVAPPAPVTTAAPAPLRARVQDPETSHAPGRRLGQCKTLYQALVLRALWELEGHAGTDFDIARRLPTLSGSTVRTRRGELESLGLVERLGKRTTLNDKGHQTEALAYRVTLGVIPVKVEP